MKIAITGGTGFIGRHLALDLATRGHDIVLIARGIDKRDQSIRSSDRVRFVEIADFEEAELCLAFSGCDAIAHCAGINRELLSGDYERVHVEGTRRVVVAAKKAHVKKIVLTSFYSARPHCQSGYHESKYAAEEIIRASGIDYTVLKAGMIYGRGDHMLDHLSHVFHTLPLFALVGFKKQYAAPLAIEDLVRIMSAALVESRLSRQTTAVLGPERLSLEAAVRRVASVVGKTPLIFPMPLFFHYQLAAVLEAVMKIPLVSKAQIRILSEGFSQPYADVSELPEDLKPKIHFTPAQIKKGLPEPGSFKLKDLRCSRASTC